MSKESILVIKIFLVTIFFAIFSAKFSSLYFFSFFLIFFVAKFVFLPGPSQWFCLVPLTRFGPILRKKVSAEGTFLVKIRFQIFSKLYTLHSIVLPIKGLRDSPQPSERDIGITYKYQNLLFNLLARQQISFRKRA